MVDFNETVGFRVRFELGSGSGVRLVLVSPSGEGLRAKLYGRSSPVNHL